MDNIHRICHRKFLYSGFNVVNENLHYYLSCYHRYNLRINQDLLILIKNFLNIKLIFVYTSSIYTKKQYMKWKADATVRGPQAHFKFSFTK